MAFDQIDSIPDPCKCGSSYRSITNKTGDNFPLSTVIDNPAGGSAAILSGLMGNVSRSAQIYNDAATRRQRPEPPW